MLSIFKNISNNYIRMAIISAISFLSSIIFARLLGPDKYGLYTYMIWLTGTITAFLGLGLGGTITKFLPEYYHNYKVEQGKKFLKALFKIQIIVIAIMSVLLVVSIPLWKDKLLNINGNDLNILLIISIISILPSALLALYISSIQALQRFDVFSRVSIIFQSLGFVLNVLIIILFKDVKYILIVVLLMTIGQVVIYARQINKLLGHCGNYSNQVEESSLDRRRILNYAKYMYINIIWQQVVFTKSEIFFLGIYSSASEIAIYGVAFGLVNIVSSLFRPLMEVLNNIFSNLVAKNDKVTLENIVNTVTRYFIIVLIFVLISAITLSKEVIILMYSNQFFNVATVFLILLIGFVITQGLGIAGSIPFLVEKQKFIINMGIVVGIVNLLLDFLLIPTAGAIGAAIANTITQSLSAFIGYLYIKKIININLQLRDLFPFFLLSSFIAITIAFVNSFFIKVLILSLFFIVGSFVLIFFKIVSKDELKSIMNLAK